MGRAAKNVLPFNDLAVKRVIKEIKEADGDRPQEWRVEGYKRLVLIVNPTGSAVFFVFYTNRRGKRRKLRIGEYNPDYFTLSDARAAALEQLAAIEKGADPVGDMAAKATAITFKQLAEKCFKEHRDLAPTTRRNYSHCLTLHAYKLIGDLPAEDVSADHVVAICKSVEANGVRVQADRVKTAIGGVYRWGLKQRLVKSSPARGIARRAPAVARTRTPTDDELAKLWDATEREPEPGRKGRRKASASDEGRTKKNYENKPLRLSRAMRLIIQLAMLTGQRRTEVAGARLVELHGLDGDAPVWIIPGDTNVRGKISKGRTKNRREQRVPLSWQAAELFRKAVELASENAHADGEHVFPADVGKMKPGKKQRAAHIHGESVSRAMIRLRAAVGIDDINVHDMRRAISNWLKDRGVSREIRDLVLNHLDPSVTERHYSQEARMEKQVRDALQAWADHVWKVTGQAKPNEPAATADNVVPMLKRA